MSFVAGAGAKPVMTPARRQRAAMARSPVAASAPARPLSGFAAPRLPMAARRRRVGGRTVTTTNALPEIPSIVIPSVSSDVGYPFIYATLGASLVGFLGTFLIAPRFKSSFKEEDSWRTMYAELAESNVKTITPEQAKAKRGAVLLDVRLANKAINGMAEGSINIPLYQPIQGWDIASNIRRAGFAFFGIFGTERNLGFIDEVLEKVPKNKEVVVMCEMGGSLENKSGTKTGFQSRSLKAAYYLNKAGYSKVLHMEEGLGGWDRAGLPLMLPDQE